MKIEKSALGALEVGVMVCVPVYGNRKQVIANVEQCLVFRDKANAIIKMLLALEEQGGYRFLLVEDPDKIEQLRKGAKKLKNEPIHPAFSNLLA